MKAKGNSGGFHRALHCLRERCWQARRRAEDKQLYIIGVFHADVSNSFSSVVKKGVEQAGKDLNIKVEFVGPDKFDVVAEGQLIEAAIAKKPDGLFVSLPDCDALKPAVQAALKEGIPVMSFNAGAACFKDAGSLVHVAEDGVQGGIGAGERLVALGAKNVICLVHEPGNAVPRGSLQGHGDGAREGRRQEHQRARPASPTRRSPRARSRRPSSRIRPSTRSAASGAAARARR